MDDFTGPDAGGAPPEPGPGDKGAAEKPGGAAPVDIQRLADKVYRLMIVEARLERARGRPAQRPSAR